jgi:hypothetical protein
VPACNSKRRPDSLGNQARTPGSGMKGWLNLRLMHNLDKHIDIVA